MRGESQLCPAHRCTQHTFTLASDSNKIWWLTFHKYWGFLGKRKPSGNSSSACSCACVSVRTLKHFYILGNTGVGMCSGLWTCNTKRFGSTSWTATLCKSKTHELVRLEHVVIDTEDGNILFFAIHLSTFKILFYCSAVKLLLFLGEFAHILLKWGRS